MKLLGIVWAVALAGSVHATPAAWKPHNRIDELTAAKWAALRITPAELCSDATFLRRAYLDVIGTLPTVAEVRDFLADRNPNKRAVLVDQLLAREEFADYWSLKWCDILRVKAEYPINLWPNAVQAYHRWIRTALSQNWPYDRFARELLTATGSNFRVPPANFYRAMQDRSPKGIAHTVALTFLGQRADKWPPDRQAGFAAFFSQVRYKTTGEWKEEIVFHDAGMATNNLWRLAVFPDGTPANLREGVDPRAAVAEWLVAPGNQAFNRAIANRVWSWLLGRGIIHEPDDIRPDNPPANPELLAYLEHELVAAKYDLKHLFRIILNSRTYQLASVPQTKTPAAEAQFAYYPVRRLEAEVIIDAINQITGTTEKYSSPIPEPFTYIPEEHRTIALADASISSPFLELFGRSNRDTGLETERNNRITPHQRLHLLNSSHIQRKLEHGQKMRALLSGRQSLSDMATTLYLTILSRYPTDEELKVVRDYAAGAAAPRDALVDIAWALINSNEFLHRH